jgi:hypothetical protein
VVCEIERNLLVDDQSQMLIMGQRKALATSLVLLVMTVAEAVVVTEEVLAAETVVANAARLKCTKLLVLLVESHVKSHSDQMAQNQCFVVNVSGRIGLMTETV